VRDAVRRAEESLDSLEEKLGMIARFDRLRAQRAEIAVLLSDDSRPRDAVIREALQKLEMLEI
jgi:predicted DNA-binding protein YlxM (UPF0122 family)